MGKTIAIAKAKKIFKDYCLDEPVMYNRLYDIATDHNVEINYWKFPVGVDGMLHTFDSGKYFIGINEGTETYFPARATFTLAHELGHYFLHRKIGGAFFCDMGNTDKTNPIENEANAFAAELLMPSMAVKRLYRKMCKRELSDYFGVSPTAMGYRLMNLGLI